MLSFSYFHLFEATYEVLFITCRRVWPSFVSKKIGLENPPQEGAMSRVFRSCCERAVQLRDTSDRSIDSHLCCTTPSHLRQIHQFSPVSSRYFRKARLCSSLIYDLQQCHSSFRCVGAAINLQDLVRGNVVVRNQIWCGNMGGTRVLRV